MVTIKVDYAKANRQALQLRQIANDCTAMKREANILRNSQGGPVWSGSAANEFRGKMDQWAKDMQALEKTLNDIAGNIEKTVRKLQLAEAAAANMPGPGGM
ncbi:MAG: WXG100 family type VII secretion target [Clostridiales bacterium]|nr:WXG100 family type VII secretion target [Clostridiales bacterium]